jgi:hypothetical protein
MVNEITNLKNLKGIKMEIIGYGILLAIGWYIAPFLITAGIGIIVGFFALLGNIFGGRKEP